MAEHRYPRRWKSIESENAYFECREPNGVLRYWTGSEWITPAYVNNVSNEAAIDGNRTETFDHLPVETCPIEEQFKTRSAIVYLKGLVKDLRARNSVLEARVKELENAGT